MDQKIFDVYAGRYEIRPGFVLTVSREGSRLMTQATGQPKVELVAESETEFFHRVMDLQLSFDKDGSGRVTHAVLQGGWETRAPRIE